MGKNYKVEDITAKRQIDGEVYYRIKWVGYPRWQNSWEPQSNLSKDIIQYWQQKQKQNKILKQNRERMIREKEQRKDYWWHQIKVNRHFYDEEGHLRFQIISQNKKIDTSKEQLISKNSRILAQYYISQAKRRKIY